jgi:hypothetical protein
VSTGGSAKGTAIHAWAPAGFESLPRHQITPDFVGMHRPSALDRAESKSIPGGVPEDLEALVGAVARTAAREDSPQPCPEQRVLGLHASDPLLEHGDAAG